MAIPVFARWNSSRASASALGGKRSPPQALSPPTRAKVAMMTARIEFIGFFRCTSVSFRLLQVLLGLLRRILCRSRLRKAQRQLGLDARERHEAPGPLVVLVHQIL